MDGDITTTRGLVLPAYALTWRFSRSSGPGGQGVNTTDSRVELIADLVALVGPDEMVQRVKLKLGEAVRIVVSTERSQLRNRELAIERLTTRLDIAARIPRVRRPTRASAASVRRRLDEKRTRGETKRTRRDVADPDADG